MAIIITGGLGFIGSHTALALAAQNQEIIILDNCINSSPKTHKLLEQLKTTTAKISHYNVDITNYQALIEIAIKIRFIINNPITAIIHFAALKAVGESNEKPLDYYHNNITGLINMVRFAKLLSCPNFIFSSSATVYPHNAPLPCVEDGNHAQQTDRRYSTIITAAHPYGNTKLIGEQILNDVAAADKTLNIIILRYFNPVGNHESGLLGEDFINARPNNLFPAILSAMYNNTTIKVFGTDYNTPDGSAIRDFIHVSDVADAHVVAMNWLKTNPGIHCFNVGSGHGYSVLSVINNFIKHGAPLKYECTERRQGDAEQVYADTTRATNILEWTPKYTLDDMVKHTLIYYNKVRSTAEIKN